jgi:opacity protein-like surface antigen
MYPRLGAIAAIALSLGGPTLAHAAGDFYVGANFVRITDKGAEAPAIHPLVLELKGGMEFTPNFALEARVGSGIKSDSANVSGIDVDLKVNYLYGLYAKGRYEIAGVTPYILLGYTQGKETATIPLLGMSQSEAHGAFSYGIGLDVPVSERVSINAEWANLVRGNDNSGVGFSIKGWALGATLKF